LYFLQRHAEYLNPISETYAYCLMPNHFHFLVRIRSEENLLDYYKTEFPSKNPQGLQDLTGLNSKQYSNFFNAYTRAFNNQQNRTGRLFLRSVDRKPVTHQSYFNKLIHYIHYNPVHHGFVKSIDDWTYSPYHSLLSAKNTKLGREKVVKSFGGMEEFIKVHNSKPDKNLFLEMDF
jgi:putative transposase